jgi:hypothetical protein
MVLLYHATTLFHAWRENRRVTTGRSTDRTKLTAVPLDTHIATAWADGRRQLDALLAMTEALAASLEQELTQLTLLGASNPLHEQAARSMVALPCVVLPSTNVSGMSAACWSPS